MESNQKHKRTLAAKETGEAQSHAEGGSDLSIAGSEYERLPCSSEFLLEEVVSPSNLEESLKRVVRNKGGAGMDGMTVTELKDYMHKHGQEVRERILSGHYKPTPVKRVEIPSGKGKVRKLGIPTVLDRLIQQALYQVLEKYWEPTFSDHSYGFRPGRNCHQAVYQIREYIEEGYTQVVDIDLEKFFDKVQHDKLMSEIAKRIKDKRVLKLLRSYLNSGMMEGGIVQATKEGVPQGGPLSPLLSNIMLDLLDKELERRGLRFARYADDCMILVKSERAAHRVMKSVSDFIEKKLKLKVNREKSEVAPCWRTRFLGFSWVRRGRDALIQASKESLKKLKEKLKRIVSVKSGRSGKTVLKELRQYLNGWYGYYWITETKRPIETVEQLLRRRLRATAWYNWKTPRNRFRKLMSLGLSRNECGHACVLRDGVWKMSINKHLNRALPNRKFDEWKLPRLETFRRVQLAKQHLNLGPQAGLI